MNILLTNYSIDHVFPANPNKRACLRTLHTIKSFTRHRMRGTQVSASATSQDLRKRGASFKMSVQCHKQKGKQPNGGKHQGSKPNKYNLSLSIALLYTAV